MTATIDPLVLWVLPASWFVHDAEEIATIEAWSRRFGDAPSGRRSGVRRRIVERLASTRRRFAIAVALVAPVVVGATVAGHLDPSGPGIVVYTTVLGGYFLHAFVHLAQSLALRGYVPGLLTAVGLVAPASLYLYSRLLGADVVDLDTVAVTGVVGLVVFVPVVVGAGALATRIDRRLA